MASEKPVFVRKTSGLVREMDLKDIILWNSVAAGIGLGEISFLVPVYLGIVPGAHFLLGGILAMIAGLIIDAVYAHFLSAMPRSGGEYVFLSRLAHPLVGFFFSFSMAMLWLLAYAINMEYSASMFIPFIGIFTGGVSEFWLTPTGLFIVSFIMSFIALVVAIAGMRAYIKYQLVITGISVLATILYIGVLVSIGNFKTAFNSFAAPYYPGVADPYTWIINEAVAAGYTLPSVAPPSIGSDLGMMVIFGFAGMLTCATFSSFVAGEMKRAESGKRQMVGLMGGLLLNGIIAIVLSLLTMYVIDPDFMAALGWIQWNAPELFKLPVPMLGMPFALLEWLAHPAVAIIIDLALWLLALTWAIMDLIVLSRLMFAWSFDRLLPTGITHTSDRFHTPTYAIGVSWILGIIFGALGIWTEIIAFLSAAGWLVYTTFIAVGLTAIFFPFAKKKLYETMPLKANIGPIPVLSILGLLAVIIFGAMASVYIWGPEYASAAGVWSPTTTGILIFFYIVAIVIYTTAYLYWKSKGLDLSLAFKEIPPA